MTIRFKKRAGRLTVLLPEPDEFLTTEPKMLWKPVKAARTGFFGRISCAAFLLKPAWKQMAHPAGFEPATPRSEVACSIQLSYGCALVEG